MALDYVFGIIKVPTEKKNSLHVFNPLGSYTRVFIVVQADFNLAHLNIKTAIAKLRSVKQYLFILNCPHIKRFKTLYYTLIKSQV